MAAFSNFPRLVGVTIFLLMNSGLLSAQQGTSEREERRHLYRPSNTRVNDSLSGDEPAMEIRDQVNIQDQVVQDSIDARNKFLQDSLAVRLQFIQDSLLARQIFVRDSIARRMHILDSLKFLTRELPKLFDASLKTFYDDIVVYNSGIGIHGDSILGNYTFYQLPFAMDKEFTPWKATINLSDNPIKISIDTVSETITAIQSPLITAVFKYRNKLLIIEGKSSIVNKPGAKLYKQPVDSVFFSSDGKIGKIKRYQLFYQVISGYQRGAFQFSHLAQVKQFEYQGTKISKYGIVNFCERGSASAAVKVCNVIEYGLSQTGNRFVLTKNTNPKNDYGDGAFTYEFDSDYTLQSLAFTNNNKSEDWKTFIEVNDMGYVSSYIYQNKGWVHQTLLINYYLNDPGAKHKIEKIICTFEDDGISYYQQNQMTGKSRRRDKMTGEWGPWQ